MNLEQIIHQHTEAVGGKEAIEAIRALKFEFEVIEPSFTASGRYVAERQGQMRVDIFIENRRVFSEGVHRQEGWQLFEDVTRAVPTTDAGTNALKRGVENQLFGLHELPSRGHQLELVGQETLDGTSFWVIKVNYVTGAPIRRYINPNTWLIERSREKKALHPDLDPTKVTLESRHTDFRQVGGIWRSFHEEQINLVTGETVQTTQVNNLQVNPAIEPNFFTRPE